ncbi:iron-containing alcohol dehydrogenase [Cedecea sp. FDAARGOS_727]|uniref:iron-containing alcohol dehydrogenase n=1 Tax=Cedecea sp. FDAARGOS_727 TaxID=2545798 RepID=UPI00143EADE7|nr:iron-containing alcohol dehydrogenase [Cedecea sp. FDAARGOS_727]QIX96972.1 iron-containing alcohol dehydrogenase [Cedecea sp. FDAARGOS_727]
MDTSTLFCSPAMNFLGSNSLQNALKHSSENYHRIFFVCDSYLLECGLASLVIDELEKLKLTFCIFKDFQANPGWHHVQSAISTLKSYKPDLIVSFGGGSAHDFAKAIAFFSANEGSLDDYQIPDCHANNTLPIMCINSTAGTGAETTRVSIITDEDSHIKRVLLNYRMLPLISVNDPNLMLNQPEMLAAATGLDALTHAIESFLAKNNHPLTDALATQAIRLILRHLLPTIIEPTNVIEKDKMVNAAMMAGLATNAGLGYVHALAHQLGGIYGLQHGVCCALLLPSVLHWLSEADPDRLTLLAYECGFNSENSARENMFKLIHAIEKLIDLAGIVLGLQAFGVHKSDFNMIANNALKDICSSSTITPPTHDDYIFMLNHAY